MSMTGERRDTPASFSLFLFSLLFASRVSRSLLSSRADLLGTRILIMNTGIRTRH